MKALQAVVIIVVCAVAIAWIGDMVVSQRGQPAVGLGERAIPFAHDESHHHRHHGGGAERAVNELLESSVLFAGVAAAVVIPSVIISRKKRAI